jgi:predicted AlkP superfamily pyrophosphatase or phosphodiesterase
MAALHPTKVILITIDGMRSEMVTDSIMPSACLKMMREKGLFVKKIKGITPTATYPSHTTIITGELPSKHNIYYNSHFVGNRNINMPYWYSDSIKCTTIWERAHKKGLKVASFFWPVSTGCRYIDYNIPEFWSEEKVSNQIDYIKTFCTPKGFLEELERESTGYLCPENFLPGSVNRDSKTACMVNYTINHYDPDLITVHLTTTDYAQHATGLSSERVYEAVESADNAISLILENLRSHNKMDSTAVIVCGDHGFTNVYTLICPNVWLVKERLLSETPGGGWKACFHGCGAMMFLYLKNTHDLLAELI